MLANEPVEAQHRLAALQALHEEVNMLRGEVFRLRKDAERYRATVLDVCEPINVVVSGCEAVRCT